MSTPHIQVSDTPVASLHPRLLFYKFNLNRIKKKLIPDLFVSSEFLIPILSITHLLNAHLYIHTLTHIRSYYMMPESKVDGIGKVIRIRIKIQRNWKGKVERFLYL